MNDTPLISVIIPTYNREHTLLRAVKSVLNQTYRNIECIVVDDCSTDRTKSVISEVNDARLRYIVLEHNSGACAARNRGIDEANGDIIAFNDSDDEWHSDKLEKQLSYFMQSGADVIASSMAVFDEEANKFLFNFPDSKKVRQGQVLYEDLLRYNSASTQLLFGKAECFKNNKFEPKLPRFQDWDEALRISRGYRFFHHDEILVDTFIQKDSITRNPQKALAAFEILYNTHKDTIEKNKSIKAAFFRKKAAFVWRNGISPTEEFSIVWKNERTLKNLLRLVLARLNLYAVAGKLLRKQ